MEIACKKARNCAYAIIIINATKNKIKSGIWGKPTFGEFTVSPEVPILETAGAFPIAGMMKCRNSAKRLIEIFREGA